MQLWLECQRDFDISHFELRIESSSSSSFPSASSSSTQIAQRRPSEESQVSSSTASSSLKQLLQHEKALEDEEQKASKHSTGPGLKTSDPKPGIRRTPSGEAGRKRSNIATGGARGRTRPSITRKRSSQAGPTTQPLPPSAENVKPKKSIIKNPRTSEEEQNFIDNNRESTTVTSPQKSVTISATDETPGRKISTFELPSASSDRKSVV